MFNFIRKHSRHPSTILIDGLDAVINDRLTVESVWQQSHMTSTIGDILSKAINDPGDQIDNALLEYLHSHTLSVPAYKPFHTIAFNPHDGISGNVWHHGEYYLPAIKGMPEHILEHCDMSENERESIMIQLHSMSATGDTIIAIATGLLTRDIKDIRHLKSNEKLSFVGFISLHAAVSSVAKQLLANTSASVYLVTGHHPAAAYAITHELGLTNSPNDVFDARRLDVMNTSEIHDTVTSAKAFARATPERKEHIFDAIKAIDKSAARITTLADLQKLLAN